AYRNGVNRFVIGITPSAEENIVPRVIATYCNQYPDTKITILTDTIRNITNKLKAYEVDIAIVEGHIPDKGLTSILLDTDYLCLIVSPDHPFADRKDVSLEEVKKERLIVRPRGAGTRHMFETYLEGCGESLQNFHVILEIDSVSTIKDLVQSNLGVSVIAHSTCISEERSGRLKVIPIVNFQTFREINLVCREDFSQKQLLDELCNIYRTCM
ncbi:LysR family transcriptional regulator substrate-binding protein, partial [Anaerotignum lactatifermentans]